MWIKGCSFLSSISICLIYLFNTAISLSQVTWTWENHPIGATSHTQSIGTCTMTTVIDGHDFNTTPRYTQFYGSGLFIDHNWANTTSFTTVTITFSTPILNPSFAINDVNRNGPCLAFCTSAWTDRVTVTPNTGIVTAISANPPEHTITGSGTGSVIMEANLVCDALNSAVNVQITGSVSTITFRYDSGSGVSRTSGSGFCSSDPSGCFANRVNCPDPGRQYIAIGDITGQMCCSGSADPVYAGPDQVICQGQSVTLNASGSSNYTWNNGVSNGIPFSPNSTQTYTVNAIDANGCQSTDNLTVTVNAAPTVSAGPNQTICNGEQVTLTGQGASTYTWDNGVENGIPFIPGSTQTYTVVGSTNGCTNTSNVTVTVENPPTISIIGDNPVCEGQQTTLSGQGAATYSWDNGVLNGVPFTPSSGQTYTVTGYSSAGCENTASVVIQTLASPIVTANNDISVCAGQSVILSGNGALTYSWDNDIIDGESFVPTTTTTYTVVGTDENGCTNTAQVNVTIGSGSLQLDAGQDQTICEGTAVTLAVQGTNTPNWSNGIVDGEPFIPTTSQTYTVTATDENGCEASDNVSITLIPYPTFSISSNEPGSCGSNDGSITLNGLLPNTTYTFSYNSNIPITVTSNQNGQIVIANLGAGNYANFNIELEGCATNDNASIQLNDPNPPFIHAGDDLEICEGESITLSAQNPTDAQISWNHGVVDGMEITPSEGLNSYTVTANLNGCIASDQVNVSVYPRPLIDAGQDQSVCEQNTVVLVATHSPGSSISWSNGIENGISFTPTTTQYYTVTAVSEFGCIHTDSVLIQVFAEPTIAIQVDNAIGCAPLTVNFTSISSEENVSCIWNFGNGNTSTSCTNPSSIYNASGCYDVSLSVTSISGCQNTVTYNSLVCVVDNPVANFTVNSNQITESNSTIVLTNTSTGATNYQWEFGDGYTSSDNSPTHTYQTDTDEYTIILTVENEYGCTDVAIRTIKVEEELIFYVPNAFTPDGDQFNQVFKPVFSGGFDPYNYQLILFNRWGEVIFESYNAEFGWDGTYGGQIAQDGVYIWKLAFKVIGVDKREIHTGHVTLIR